MRERVELRIAGRVQGVWYRASAEKEARRLGLAGWVRNGEDGTVEAVAEGERAALEDFIAWCRKGPIAARVDDVQTRWSPATGEFEGFSTRR